MENAQGFAGRENATEGKCGERIICGSGRRTKTNVKNLWWPNKIVAMPRRFWFKFDPTELVTEPDGK